MTVLVECRVCGSAFEPDSNMRKLCEDCRDDGYRKKQPGLPKDSQAGRLVAQRLYEAHCR